MKNFLKATGKFFLGGIMLISMFVVALFFFTSFFKGGIWLGNKILPWLFFVGGIVFIFDLCLFLPLGIFKKTKSIASVGLLVSSYVYGLTLWLWSLLFVYMVWGWFAVFVGLGFMGIGIVPVALLAIVVKGHWIVVCPFISYLVCIYGSRSLGLYFSKQAEELQLKY